MEFEGIGTLQPGRRGEGSIKGSYPRVSIPDVKSRGDGARSFSVVFYVRIRDNEYKLKYIKFHVNIPYDFFIILNFYFIVRIAQKGHGVPTLGNIQNPVGYNPEPSPLTDRALSRAVELDHNHR